MLITIGFDEQESLDVFALDLTRTVGTPIDSFEARLLWSAGAADAARCCERVRIYADGKLVSSSGTSARGTLSRNRATPGRR